MLRRDCLRCVTPGTKTGSGVVEERRRVETLGLLGDASALPGPTAFGPRTALPLQEGW